MKDLTEMSRGEKIEALGQENIIPRPAALIVVATLVWVIFGFAVLLGVTGVLNGGLAILIGFISFFVGVFLSGYLPGNEIKDVYFKIKEIDDSGLFKVLRKKVTGDYHETSCLVEPNGVVHAIAKPDLKNHILIQGSLDCLWIKLVLTDEYRKEIEKAPREAK